LQIAQKTAYRNVKYYDNSTSEFHAVIGGYAVVPQRVMRLVPGWVRFLPAGGVLSLNNDLFGQERS
jgi:hypothetical protein